MDSSLLVIGSLGQLGRATVAAAERRGLRVTGHDLDTVDITDPAAVDGCVAEVCPDWVCNCAAFTDVDGAETREDEAMAVNGAAVGHLAAACNRHGAGLLHVSTDYVFPGTGDRPYREDDPVAPLGVYGRSKLVGELRAVTADRFMVVRTSWLFGHGGRNFVEAIRDQIEAGRDRLRVVADQEGCPTYASDLAEALLDLTAIGATGVVHAANDGATTWHGFAVEIARQLGAEVAIEPAATGDLPRPAPRPTYSVLDTSRLTGLRGPLPPWQDALTRYLKAR